MANGQTPSLISFPTPFHLHLLDSSTELAVLEQAEKSPELGPQKAGEALVNRGHEVSASGVRWIWKRHEIHRAEYRLDAMETGSDHFTAHRV